MRRCFQLAKLGAGLVAPNPMVGAVLVYQDRIIGEGYHGKYGEAHAEVSCINSVNDEDQHLVEQSTLYVSLEPCAHFGKTPPCADLVIRRRIPEVVIGCRDSYAQVDGKGIKKLADAGTKIICPVLEKEALELNRRFFTFHSLQRPYILLKWAQTADGKIGNNDDSRLLVSNELTNREVHRWRSIESSILVGTRTALQDDPSLTNRLWAGSQPLRLVVDNELKLPTSLHLFDGSTRTIVFNTVKDDEKDNVKYYKVQPDQSLVHQILKSLYLMNIQSVMVEGGARLLQSFIDENYWDEARIIVSQEFSARPGVMAPMLPNAQKIHSRQITTDTIHYYKPAGSV